MTLERRHGATHVGRKFKVESLKLNGEREVTVAQASRDVGVHGTVLHRWVQECAAGSRDQSNTL
ncbi:MAG: hypothetical protein SGJ26_20095 [Nitrospirota bacterium]|nr:hypothetical protein [Nitrospirota bacterium]